MGKRGRPKLRAVLVASHFMDADWVERKKRFTKIWTGLVVDKINSEYGYTIVQQKAEK